MTKLPEIREADASPPIAAIYADIREVTRLPQVNLIHRYFATKPGVLEWIWGGVRRLYDSKEFADAADRLARSVERPGASPLADALGAADLAQVRRVIEVYNSGNAQNVVALTALARLIDNRHAPRSLHTLHLTPRDETTAPADDVTFSPLPRREALSSATMACVEKLAARHDTAPGVIPSLYLHLAYWPDALTAADEYLQPIIEGPEWPVRVAEIKHRAGTAADRLVEGIDFSLQPPAEDDIEEVSETLRAFVGGTIPQMVVVGRLLAIE